jgi:hypothetical protein
MAQPDIPEFAELSREAKENYNTRMISYKEELQRYGQGNGTQVAKNDGFVYVESSASATSDSVAMVQSASPGGASPETCNGAYGAGSFPVPVTDPIPDPTPAPWLHLQHLRVPSPLHHLLRL